MSTSNAGTVGSQIVLNVSVRNIYARARKLSRSDLPILISGETGVGKEVLARFIHESSPRNLTGDFVALNCATIPDHLIETELFGYSKGAFTDARTDKVGLLTVADGGTLFLDEIAEMSVAGQKKLLRALEYKEFYPIGSVTPKSADFRLVCATSESLDKMVSEKTFRADLYHRIHACELTLPPLRDRIDEIPFLARYFVDMNDRKDILMSPDVIEVISCYSWPGNIRELKNVIEYALAMLDENERVIEVYHLPEEKFYGMNCGLLRGMTLTLKEKERCFKENLVRATMTACSGDYKSVAQSLGTSKSTIYELVAGKESRCAASPALEE